MPRRKALVFMSGFILVTSRILRDVTPDEKVPSSSTQEISDCLRNLTLSLINQNFKRFQVGEAGRCFFFDSWQQTWRP